MGPLILIGYFLAALLVGFMGRHRAFGFWGFFLASLFLTPGLAVFILLVTAAVGRK